MAISLGRSGFLGVHADERVTASAFESEFRTAFQTRFTELFRLIDRFTGEEALASDVAQETFVRLYRRGEMPDDLRAWLVSVALNLVRDERRRSSRRLRLLSSRDPGHTMGDAPRAADEELIAEEQRVRVRRALDALPERDRALLLLRQEGYSYRELASAVGVQETSVGTLLSRAKEAFRAVYDPPGATTSAAQSR
jgi:RNA polymerase sigma factor (sigma-70 family)